MALYGHMAIKNIRIHKRSLPLANRFVNISTYIPLTTCKKLFKERHLRPRQIFKNSTCSTVNLPKSGCACIKKFCCGLGGGLSRTKNRSGTRCAHQFWPQGARSAASALARSQRNGRLPARAHASIKIGARIQSEFRIQIMHA